MSRTQSPPKVSVCISAYEMFGRGAEYLSVALESLSMQDFGDFEVVVSDQSGDSAISEVCAGFNERLNVRHIRNSLGALGSAANTNNAIRAARGEIVKILFQDDALATREALGKVVDAMDTTQAHWCVTGSELRTDMSRRGWRVRPRIHGLMYLGHNKIGYPSVLAVRRAEMPTFDEDLNWLMDVDLYFRLQLQFGRPAIIDEVLVLNRIHPGQQSSILSRAEKRAEARYALAKYDKHRDPHALFYYFHRYVLPHWFGLT